MNQFETGRSRGAPSLPLRAHLENRLFGIPLRAGGRLRPIYGYLDGSDEGAVRQYGSVVVRLRKGVRRRTTFTLGDSLDDTALGKIPMLAPVRLTSPSAEATYTDFDLVALPSMQSATPRGYAEAQIHGRVALADILEVVYTRGAQPDATVNQAMIDAGLEWRTVPGEAP